MTNPFRDATEKVQRHNNDFSLGLGVVQSIPSDGRHRVRINVIDATTGETGETGPDTIPVSVQQSGDIALPSSGDTIVFGRLSNGENIMLGTVYTSDRDTRDYDPQERHIGVDSGVGVFLHGGYGVVPKTSESVTGAPDGAVWYRTDLDEYRGIENGTKVSFDTTTV